MPPSSAAAYQSLQDFSKSMIDPQTALTQGQTQYGVQGLGSQVDALRSLTNNLQTSINGVDPSVTGRTQGGLVTEAQRQAIVNKERSPLVDQFNTTSGHLNDANSQYGNAQNYASQYTQALLTGQTNKLSALDALYKDAVASEAAAEQKREFDAQQAAAEAAARRAAAGANPGLNLGSLLGGGAAANAAGQPAANTKDPSVLFGLIQALRQSPGGVQKYNWGNLATEFKNRGIDVTHGSAADQALNAYFNAAGSSPIAKASPFNVSVGLQANSPLAKLVGLF